MLRQRIITAVVMAAVFLAAVTFASLPVLALLFAVLVAVGGWEWSRMAGWQGYPLRAAYVVALLVIMGVLYVYCDLAGDPQDEQVQPFLGVACLWWSIALLWLKGYPGSALIWGNLAMRSLMGLLILAPAWMAAVFLLSYPRGSLLVVCLVVVVAAADIGAYFTGKSLGRHKLAQEVSPNKTWEGFWGGMMSCLLLAVLVWYLLPATYSHVSLAALITVFVATGLVSVVGDLIVSMVKRNTGIKDSGSLLPGHGGVLDRLDSICGAAPVFTLGLLLAGW